VPAPSTAITSYLPSDTELSAAIGTVSTLGCVARTTQTWTLAWSTKPVTSPCMVTVTAAVLWVSFWPLAGPLLLVVVVAPMALTLPSRVLPSGSVTTTGVSTLIQPSCCVDAARLTAGVVLVPYSTGMPGCTRSPGFISCPFTRTVLGMNVTRPSGTVPVTVRWAACCQRRIAVAVAPVNFWSTVSPSPKPMSRRLVSSCSTSTPSLMPEAKSRQTGRPPYISVTRLPSTSYSASPRLTTVPIAGSHVRVPGLAPGTT